MTRCRLITIPDDIMIGVLEGRIKLTNRPANSKIGAVHYDERRGTTMVRLMCDEFDDVLPGTVIPPFFAMWEENHD